jgi:signal transduction histidine kinase/PAS domain-containing protein
MPIVESELALLRHPRLAALATSAYPAWLWRGDGSRILWANAAGAAIFGAASPAECRQRRFTGQDPSAAEIIRLAKSLPPDRRERLERLRGFGPAAGLGRTLVCACSRTDLDDGAAAILVAAIEPAEQSAPPPPSPQAPLPPAADEAARHEPAAERRHPLRLVWQMDAEGRFVVGSDEFIELVGPQGSEALGRLWSEIATDLRLDPENLVGRAVATRETWSGINVSWPMADSSERLQIELSGLPVFDRDCSFRGYRGFGVCRDLARINQLRRARHAGPSDFVAVEDRPRAAVPKMRHSAAAGLAATSLEPAAAVAIAVEAVLRADHAGSGSANVLPFRSGSAAEPKAPSLSPVERTASRQLAQELIAGRDRAPPPVAAPTATAAATDAPTDATECVTEDVALPEHTLLDRVPAGVLVYRGDALLYANRYFLQWSGYESLDALAAAGGLNRLFVEPSVAPGAEALSPQVVSIKTRSGEEFPVEGRLFAILWRGASALALIVSPGQVAPAAAKAELLAKINREIRTPLNAVIGFAEMMMTERFGALGNDRYAEYVKDIHAAGTQIAAYLNDISDLSKIETGQLALNFADLNLNDLTRQCVTVMQPQASQARIIIRSSLSQGLPDVTADERSLRQIVLNLLVSAINSTGPGGQIIVSTGHSDGGETILRVRDTGAGMSATELEALLGSSAPAAAAAASAKSGDGGGALGLPLCKALAEANHARFDIKSAPSAGTLVEIAFLSSRPSRALAADSGGAE